MLVVLHYFPLQDYVCTVQCKEHLITYLISKMPNLSNTPVYMNFSFGKFSHELVGYKFLRSNTLQTREKFDKNLGLSTDNRIYKLSN